MKQTGPTNQGLRQLIMELRKESSTKQTPIWSRIAEDLEKSTRRRSAVNLSKINRFTKKDEVVIIPGKVLGAGALDHSVVVAAFTFSESARERIQAVKGTCMSISELMKQYPKGTNIRILA